MCEVWIGLDVREEQESFRRPSSTLPPGFHVLPGGVGINQRCIGEVALAIVAFPSFPQESSQSVETLDVES